MKRSIRWLLPALFVLGGCKSCQDNPTPTPAKVVEIDAAEVTVEAGAPQHVLGATFTFPTGVYHFDPPPPGYEAAAKKLLTDAGFAVVDGMPAEKPTAATAVFLHPSLAEFAPPSVDELAYRGRTLSIAERARLQKAAAVTSIMFVGPGTEARSRYRTALQAMLALEKAAPGVLWDEDARDAMTRAAWSARLDDWTGDVPWVERQLSIDVYREGELLRLVTMGMARFALPDIVVEQLTSHDTQAMGKLVNVLCQSMVEQGDLTRPGEMDLAMSALKNAKARGAYGAEVVDGGSAHATVTLAITEGAKGDPENRLLAVVFPGSGAHLQERQSALLEGFLGSRDSLIAVKNSPTLLAASARQRAKALLLKPRFAVKPPDAESLVVKAPFKTPSGGTEWMWVEVVSWTGTTIHGVLESDPYEVPGLKAGARVDVEESSIFDYIHHLADGGIEGNETAPLLGER